MERQIITVDIAPGYNKVERLKSSQGDIGRPLGVYITQNGTALDCSAYTADLYILKPDGNFFTGTVTVDATEHNLITWNTAKQETPVAGECAAQIRILNNGDDIGTARFVEYVEASPGFCGEASESVVESLMEYVRQAAESAETASGAASSASGSASAASGSASAAASSASAAAGSASTAHTDAETASQAAQTAQDVADSIPEDYSTLSDDVTGLKSALQITDYPLINPIIENGTVLANGDEQFSSTANKTKIIHVKAGSKIYKSVTGMSVVCAYYSSSVGGFISSNTIMDGSYIGDYIFENDAYVKLVFSAGFVLNPSGVFERCSFNLHSADIFYQPYIDVLFYGNSNYLGNATIIKLDNSKTLMVDTFSSEAWSDLVGKIRSFGVRHLDYLMITHYHADHVGNVPNLVNAGFIDSNTIVFIPQDLNASLSDVTWDWSNVVSSYNEAKQALANSGATLITPTEQMVYNLSNSSYFKFYNTDHSVYYPGGSFESTNYNDFSLCAYLWIGGENICFTGDLGPIGQQRMVTLKTMVKANLYTATHHGWDNGSHSNNYGLIPAWIDKVDPDAVISMDYNIHNQYINTVYSPQQTWCEKNSVPNYRTDVNGAMNFHVFSGGFVMQGAYSPYIRNSKNWFFYDYEKEVVIDAKINALKKSLNTDAYIGTTGADLLYYSAVAFQGSEAVVNNTYDFRIRVVDSGNAESFAEFLVTGYKRNVTAGVYITARAINLSYRASNASGTLVVDGAVGTLTYIVECISYSAS